MAININQLWSKKTEELSGKVRSIAHGDEDLCQEGIIGIREGLMKNPHAGDAFLLKCAKYAMTNYRNRGRSVDNGSHRSYTKILSDGTIKTYKKEMRPIYVDKLMEDFELEFPDTSYQPDILAIDHICAGNFYGSLEDREAQFISVCIETRSNYFYNSKARMKLNISHNEYYRRRRATYKKFIHAFGTDEDIECLSSSDPDDHE